MIPKSGLIDRLPFDEWVQFIFVYPQEGLEWHRDIDAPYWNAPTALTAEYLLRLFEDTGPPLEGFNDEEPNQGFWYLINPGLGEHMLCLDDPNLRLSTREAVGSCPVTWCSWFAVTTLPGMGQVDQAATAGRLTRGSSLNGAMVSSVM
jgi:hypothetical protein